MKIPDLSEIPDLAPVPTAEYDLRVTKAKDITAKSSGAKGFMLMLEILGEENAETVFDRNYLPAATADEQSAQTQLRMLKEKITAMGLDPADCSTEDFVGVEFSAQVILVEADADFPRDRNELGAITG